MSNSSLVNTTVWCAEGNYTHGRSGRNIEMVALHHMAGVLSAEQCGSIFQQSGRGASANYGIGYDGKIGLYVDEYNTAWANSNWDSNCKSVSIELSNSSVGGDYPVSDTVLNKAIDLITDIFKRNNLGDYVRSKLDYIVDKVNEKLGLNSNSGTSSNDNLYKVQVGAFSKKENAEKLANEIKNKGVDTCIITEDGLYKVQCGAFENVDNAKNIAKTLNNMGYDTYIAGIDESTSSNQVQGIAYRVNCNYPNIRSSANLNSSVVRLAPRGEIIYVVGTENGFLKLNDGTYLKEGFADKV